MPKIRSSAKRSYAMRRKYSPCRGLRTSKCRNRVGCKMALGKKRSFCRRSRSSRTRRNAHSGGQCTRGRARKHK